MTNNLNYKLAKAISFWQVLLPQKNPLGFIMLVLLSHRNDLSEIRRHRFLKSGFCSFSFILKYPVFFDSKYHWLCPWWWICFLPSPTHFAYRVDLLRNARTNPWWTPLMCAATYLGCFYGFGAFSAVKSGHFKHKFPMTSVISDVVLYGYSMVPSLFRSIISWFISLPQNQFWK